MRQSARPVVCFLAMLTVLAACVGCGRAINRTAERRIREALPDVLGTARQYRVHVEGTPERAVGGNLARVVIDGDDVELRNGLVVDHLRLDLKGVRYDTGKRRLRAIHEARFEVTVSENSLDEFLAGESPPNEPIRHARVTFAEGSGITIAAERLTLGMNVPFSLSGPLRVDGAKLEIDPRRLVVVGIPITGAPLRFLMDRFVVACDLATLAFPVQLTEARTTRGTLTLSGTADVNALLKITPPAAK